MVSTGFLIPDHYVQEVPGEVDMNTSSIFWGFSLGLAIFSGSKAVKQTHRSWKRSGRITAYVSFVWMVWISSVLMGILAWLFQRQYISPSFWFFITIVIVWTLQIQFLLQIIINRLGLLMVVPGRATRMKWMVFIVILVINISVAVIWTPARLQISPTWHRLNEIWDRVEKAIFALVDGALNFYFIFLVRTRLIDNGLTKYTPLFRLNIILIVISLSLDVALIGLMSLPSSLVYLSFHPVAYLAKLQIEMHMAELITKIVKSTGIHGSEDIYYKNSTSGAKSKGITGGATGGGTGAKTGKSANRISRRDPTMLSYRGGNTTQIGAGDDDSIELETREGDVESPQPGGIRKTVQTTVASAPIEERDGDTDSRSSSTRKLHYHGVFER